jgi:hypothetical protein
MYVSHGPERIFFLSQQTRVRNPTVHVPREAGDELQRIAPIKQPFHENYRTCVIHWHF